MTTETTEITVESLTAIGGSEWVKDQMHRVYFNDLAGLYGLETRRYNTGNISSATLNGESISNSQARRILDALLSAKVWFDVKDGEFHFKYNKMDRLDGDDFRAIIKEIRRRLSAQEAN